MTQEEILDYNKLCAEFLGWEYAKDRDIWNPNMHHDYSFTYSINLKFHSDWNWIMEIIEKILKDYRTDFYLDFDMPVSDTFTVSIGSDGNYNSNGKSIISSKEAVINAINQFLIWYKTNNNAK